MSGGEHRVSEPSTVAPGPGCHQTFQVPKMEGFLNFIAGYFGGGFSLT